MDADERAVLSGERFRDEIIGNPPMVSSLNRSPERTALSSASIFVKYEVGCVNHGVRGGTHGVGLYCV